MKTRLAVALMGLLAHLPLPLLRGLGWLLGRLLFVLAAPRRKVALRNLALCFPEVPEAQRPQQRQRQARQQPHEGDGQARRHAPPSPGWALAGVSPRGCL